MSFLLPELTGSLPACAAPCTTQALNLTTCPVTNVTSGCLCKDLSYVETYRLCVRASCDMEQVFSLYTALEVAKNITWTWCEFHYHNHTGSSFEKIGLFVITALLFFLRQLSKVLRLSTWGPDDFMLILGYVFSLSFATSMFHSYRFGIGRDIWSLSHEEVDLFMQIFFAFEVLYVISIAALKASILFFYLRVFKLVNPTFTTVLWLTQALNLISCVAFTVAKLNQCKPFSYSWEGWDGRHSGRCIDLHALLISHAAVNLAMNLWILSLPLTQVFWLNMRKREKLGVLSMFGLGVFVSITSAIRLSVAIKFRPISNPTHDAFYLHMWSYIELSVAVIVSCLPPTRQVWRELVPKVKKRLGSASIHVSQPG